MKEIKTASFKEIEAKKKKTCYKGECFSVNPFAICNSTTPKSEDPEKFERCVKKVKKQNKIKGKK